MSIYTDTQGNPRGYEHIYRIIINLISVGMYVMACTDFLDYVTDSTYSEFIRELKVSNPPPVTGYCSNTWGSGSNCEWIRTMLIVQRIVVFVVSGLLIPSMIYYPIVSCCSCNCCDDEGDPQETAPLIRREEDMVLTDCDYSYRIFSPIFWLNSFCVCMGMIPIILLGMNLSSVTSKSIGPGAIIQISSVGVQLIQILLRCCVGRPYNGRGRSYYATITF